MTINNLIKKLIMSTDSEHFRVHDDVTVWLSVDDYLIFSESPYAMERCRDAPLKFQFTRINVRPCPWVKTGKPKITNPSTGEHPKLRSARLPQL